MLCEEVSLTELRDVLPLLLTPPDSPRCLSQRHVAGFLDYLRRGRVRWRGWRVGRACAAEGLSVAVLLPGRTAIVLLPEPGRLGVTLPATRHALLTALRDLAGENLHFAQALIEPEAAGKRNLLLEAGFTTLTGLVYLERDVSYPWVEPPPNSIRWVSYSPATHRLFAQVVLATYRDSRDCPELTGLRPIDDILAAHQAAGQFDPSLWELVYAGDAPAACLLLSVHTPEDMLELVYMGVVPECRRHGLGKLLLRRTLEQCRRVKARRLTVVADERNEPAQRLYAEFALRPAARREAYLYRWAAR